MAKLKTMLASGDFVLNQLELVIQQKEQLYGPLASLDHATDDESHRHFTIMNFDRTTPPLDDHMAILRLLENGQAIPQPGEKVICTGIVYLNNQLMEVGAYRPG